MNEEKIEGALEYKMESIIEEMLSVYEELNLFYDVSASLIYPPDFKKTLDFILGKALDILEADKAAIVLLDGQKGKMEFLSGWVSGSPLPGDHPLDMHIEGTILEKALHSPKGLIINDISNSGDGLNPAIATKSLICVPLHGKDGKIGLLTLGDRKKSDFTSKDLKLSTVLSSQAALVIENNRLIQAFLEKQNLERELEIAQEVQKSLQPLRPPTLPGYDIAALSLPCIQVGGDFYDFISLDAERLVIMIGDVMGHGVGAGLVMAAVRSALHVLSDGDTSIEKILTRVNNLLIKDMKEKKQLVTLFYGVLDFKKRKLTFANAGHEYPFVLRSSPARIEFLETTGTVVGMFDDYRFHQAEVQLNPGDLVFFYTDGVVEVMGESEERYGKEKLYQVVEKKRNLPGKELLDEVYREVAAFSGSKSMEDDLLMVVMKLLN